MTQGFDYYFKKYDEEYGFNDSEAYGFGIGFEAGAASRQAEIDELKKRIDDALRKIESFDVQSVYEILKGEQNES